MKKSIVCSVVWLCISQMAVADYILTSNDGWVRRLTDDFTTQWSTSAGNAPSTVLFGPNGNLYVSRLTAGLVEHYDYGTGDLIGGVVPAAGSTVNDVSGGTVVLQTGGSGNVESMTFGDIGGPGGFGLAHTDGIPDLIVNRRDKIEIYDGTSLNKTGTGSETWGTLLFQKYRADSASNTEDGTGGQGVAFGPNYGLTKLYVMKGVNTATSGVYEGRFHIYDLSSPTLDDAAYPSGQGHRDSGAMLVGPDVNGDGQKDVWSIDNRNNRINAYDPITGARLATGIPIVNSMGAAAPSGGLRFPTNIAPGPDGSILVTTRFRTWLDPSWAGTEQPGGNLVQLVWDQANLRAVATLKYELPGDTGRLDGVAYLSINRTVARDPSPSNRATDVIWDTFLSWTPGQQAATHDVYFGTDAENLPLVGAGQTEISFNPGRLEFGQTYYWRVDEVTAPPDSTLFKGEVWGFTTESYGYRMTNPILATASSSSNAQTGPENTVNGSGLDASDQHSISTTTMWLTKKGQTPVWIQYEFDGLYSLHQMWVWNSNQISELDYGYGAKDVTIEVSMDGATWAALARVPEFAQATAEATYGHNTTLDFGGVLAKFVRLNINSNWGDMPQSGLSEVRFFYMPMKAFQPTPVSGAVGVAVDGILNWRPGRTAASHEVYLGTDPNALSKLGTVTEHRTSLISAGAEYDRTYYWKVDEVNEAQTPATWEGDIWSFSTPQYVLVEDFESYNDTCRRIFYTWADGYGIATPECGGSPVVGNGSGSTVGNASAPYAERMVVHGGSQSMPMAFDNPGATSYSEATRTFDVSQDWTKGGIKTLVLYFHGKEGNAAGQLYVKINNSKVVYNGKPDVLTMPLWTQWNIDLASVGGGLGSVGTLTIGVSGSGIGTVYVDDIQLYRSAPAVMVPGDPGTADLSAYYPMDGDVKDGSGKGNHGTLVYDPVFVDTPTGLGKALPFDGTNDYVDLPIGSLIGNVAVISRFMP